MEKLSCFFATDIIAVSNGVKDVLLNDGIARKNVEIIWNGSANGIDSDFFNSDQPEIRNIRLDYNIGENDFIFGFVGRLTGDKGINELVSVFTEIAKDNENVKLLLVGGFENDIDSLMEVTMNDIHSNSNIIHVGIQKDVRSFLAAMDVFVFPSYREGFGIALMEAAAMNVPAISSNIIGCNEIIEENVTGFLIPPRNEEALFERMKHCIQNQSEIKQMSLITRQAVISKYEQKKLWSATMLFYRKLQNV
jgi:glycosyltransferase involved in cell wall biosynthesis